LKRLGVTIIECPLAGRIKEIYFGDFVVVKSNIDEAYRRYYLAHALGHHLIHQKGNYLYCDSFDHLNTIKREAEAEDFAAHFLCGAKTPFLKMLRENAESPIEAVAEDLQVAPEILARRINMYVRN